MMQYVGLGLKATPSQDTIAKAAMHPRVGLRPNFPIKIPAIGTPISDPMLIVLAEEKTYQYFMFQPGKFIFLIADNK